MPESELPKTVVIGIIGPPCSGKSTIARAVERQGGLWIDADTIAKEQLDDPEVIQQVVQAIGPSILEPDGSLSRAELANQVFGQDEASRRRLKKLESIVHPRTRTVIRSRVDAAKSSNTPVVILDVPLLIESGWDEHCDEVWCVDIPADKHAVLLNARGWTQDELQRRQQRQLPIVEKRQRADWIIVNDSTPEELQERVANRLEKVLADA